MQRQPFLVLPLLLAACGVGELSIDDNVGEYDEAFGSVTGVTCGTAAACSNVGNSVEVYTAYYRVGADALARGEVAQTFTGIDGSPTAVALKLRLLRALPGGVAPKLWVAVRELDAAGNVPSDDAASLWKSAGTSVDLLPRGLPTEFAIPLEPVGTPAALDANKEYALVLWTDAPASDSVHVGLASHKTASTYDGGRALRRGFRRATSDDAFPSADFGDYGADFDLSFALEATTLPPLLGHWTFNAGEELVDRSGNWTDLTLTGASIANGELNVDNRFTYARAAGYGGPTIAEKTLVSWVKLDSLPNIADGTNWGGSALTVDSVSVDRFDGIVFSEMEANRWMAGSNSGVRNQNPVPGFQESTTGAVVQMAISYGASGGFASITVCRNGVQIGAHTKGPLATWSASDAEVLFGTRHYMSGPVGGLDAHIVESRIYAGVLTCAEVASLSPVP